MYPIVVYAYRLYSYRYAVRSAVAVGRSTCSLYRSRLILHPIRIVCVYRRIVRSAVVAASLPLWLYGGWVPAPRRRPPSCFCRCRPHDRAELPPRSGARRASAASIPAAALVVWPGAAACPEVVRALRSGTAVGVHTLSTRFRCPVLYDQGDALATVLSASNGCVGLGLLVCAAPCAFCCPKRNTPVSGN